MDETIKDMKKAMAIAGTSDGPYDEIVKGLASLEKEKDHELTKREYNYKLKNNLLGDADARKVFDDMIYAGHVGFFGMPRFMRQTVYFPKLMATYFALIFSSCCAQIRGSLFMEMTRNGYYD